MTEPGTEELRELLVGTWIAIAILADALTATPPLAREELVALLGEAEALSYDKRGIAFRAIRGLIESGLAGAPPAGEGKRRRRSPLRNRPQPPD